MPNPEKKSPNVSEPAPSCEMGKSSMTRDALNKLSQEVRARKLNEDPNHYNHTETPLKASDTVSSILKEIFAGENIPKSVIDRIEIQMQANGLNLNTLMTRDGVNGWQVENGRLIFLADVNGQKQGKFYINVLPWTALKSPEVASEDIFNYDLGVYTGSPRASGAIEHIEGSADSTPHSVDLHKPDWYKEKTVAAFAILDWYKQMPFKFDQPTQAMIKKFMPMLQPLSAQTDFTPANFRRNFESKYSNNDIFGANGIYNFVLSFQRVLDKLAGTRKGNFPVELIAPGADYFISLKIGVHIDKKDERYVKTKTRARFIEDVPVVCTPGGNDIIIDQPPKGGKNTGDGGAPDAGSKPAPEPAPGPDAPKSPENPKPITEEVKTPPEQKDQIQLSPADVWHSIETMETGHFKTSIDARRTVGESLIKYNELMVARPINQNGKTYNVRYIIDKNDKVNPVRYIAYSKDEPNKVYIGNIKYDHSLLSSSFNLEPFSGSADLDLSKPEETGKSIVNLVEKP